MPGFSGKSGTAKFNGGEIFEVTAWTAEPKTNVPKYASNLTAGFKRGISAVRDWSGSIEMKCQDSGGLPAHDGDELTVQLHADDTGNNYISGTIIISGMPISVNIDEGDPVSYTFNFEGSLAWTGAGIFAKEAASSSSGT